MLVLSQWDGKSSEATEGFHGVSRVECGGGRVWHGETVCWVARERALGWGSCFGVVRKVIDGTDEVGLRSIKAAPFP